jgi:dihydrofolate synthase/folylpolyglutamate synthase
MEQLGDTLAKIAAEKAGIIKPGVTVVTGLQDPLALNVIKATAKQKKSYLSIVDEPLMDVELGLEGPHQAWNAALALEAVREAGIKLPAVQLELALKAVQWRGRFQSLRDGRLILDGAHNREAAFVLAATYETQFPGESVEIIFAAAKDKDVAGVMSALSPIVKAWHFTTFQSPRAMPTAQLREIWDSLDIAILPITEHSDLSEAIRAAGASKRLIAGSLYLVGEALALLEDTPADFQSSLQ